MKLLTKVLLVWAGYAVAILAGCAAVYVRQLNTQGTDAQASAGMYAWGDAMLFGAVFGSVALFPTGLGLYFLRRLRVFWTILAIAALALAVTGPVCAVALELLRHVPNPPAFLQLFACFGICRAFAAPLLAPAFLLSACLAPARFPRWALLGATALEGATAAYSLVHWFIMPHFR